MSDQKPYTPDDEDVRTEYVLAHHSLDAQMNAGEEFDAWLAQVKRDAAREALDGLADNLRAARDRPGTPFVRPLGFSLGYVEHYRDTHHPEPFTWTEAEDSRRLQSIADGAADHYPEEAP